MYLRKAIVGKDMTSASNLTSETQFCLETTDVDNLINERYLGDIGDVILLRRRILNCVWD